MPKVTTKEEKKTKVAPEKKRKTKKDKDPNAPKRALSAYMFFVQDHRDGIKTENPDVSFGEVGKLLGAKWKSMSDGEKKPYNDLAEADKKRAEKEKAAYTGGAKKAPAKKATTSKAQVEEDDDDDDEDDE